MKYRISWLASFWICLTACALAAPVLAAGGGKIAEPSLPLAGMNERFGSGRNVALLAELLKDPDPVVRQWAVHDLGQTHNELAVAHLAEAMKDADPGVRCAALLSAQEFSPAQTGELVGGGLSGDDEAQLLAALASVRAMQLSSAAPKVAALLGRLEPMVLSAALAALTQLQTAAPADRLKELLGHASPVVRLRAAENAATLKDGSGVADALVAMAGQDESAVRAAAMAAVGKFAYDRIAPAALAARESNDPLLRRGALWAERAASHADVFPFFLKDPSPLVRLAAIEAVGQLRAGSCVATVFTLMLDAPDEQTHLAARESLSRIAGTAVPDRAAAALREFSGKLTPSPSPLLVRNARSCCRLLGHFKSGAGLGSEVPLLTLLPPESPVIIDLAWSVGPAGDGQAAGPLQQALKASKDQGVKFLNAQRSPGARVLYEAEATASIIEALAESKVAAGVKGMLEVVAVDVQGMRLDYPSAVALRAMPGLAGPENRAAIESAVVAALKRDPFSMTAFEAAKAAAKLGMKSAVGDVEALLKARPNPPTVQAAGWAIQELTGKTPVLPEPMASPGEWIVTTTKD